MSRHPIILKKRKTLQPFPRLLRLKDKQEAISASVEEKNVKCNKNIN